MYGTVALQVDNGLKCVTRQPLNPMGTKTFSRLYKINVNVSSKTAFFQ